MVTWLPLSVQPRYFLGVDADEAKRAIIDRELKWKAVAATERAGAPDGNQNNANGRAGKEKTNCRRSTIGSPGPKRDADYLLGRVKAKAEAGDEKAVAAAERWVRGELSAKAAAREAGVLNERNEHDDSQPHRHADHECKAPQPVPS